MFPNGGEDSYWHNRRSGAWASYVLDEVMELADFAIEVFEALPFGVRQALDDATAKFEADQQRANSLEKGFQLAKIGPRAEAWAAALPRAGRSR